MHDGAIGVYSAGEGKGTSFTLELPMSRTTIVGAAQGHLPFPVADQRDTMMMTQQTPGTDNLGLAATVTRSASVTRGHAAAAAAAIIPRASSLRESRLSVANTSAPAALNTLGVVVNNVACLESLARIALSDKQSASSLDSGRKGSRMLRELSRRDALSPKSGSVSYANKRGRYLGSPLISQHNHESQNVSVDASNRSVVVGETPLVPVHITTDNLNVSAAVATASPKWNILLVDDSPLNRKMLAKTLRAAGHTCEEAGNGKEGVDMVRSRVATSTLPYDVVLMDFVMPVMDGPTATRTLRTADAEHGWREYTGPIIGLTGNAMPADINHFMAHGKQQHDNNR